MPDAHRGQRDIISTLESGVIDGCECPCECGKTNPDPLGEQ